MTILLSYSFADSARPDLTGGVVRNLGASRSFTFEHLARSVSTAPFIVGAERQAILRTAIDRAATTLMSQSTPTSIPENTAEQAYPVANFYSTSTLRQPLLPPGFDLTRARIESLTVETFPRGRQLVYVRQLDPPGEGIDRSTLLDNLDRDLERFRRILGDGGDNFHLLLAKSPMIEWTRPPTNLDFTVEELQSHPDAEKLVGPWTIWVDTEEIVTKQTSILFYPLSTGLTTVVTFPFYACVEDGKVLGSLDDYHIHIDDSWFNQVLGDCISGRLGSEWSPAEYGRGVSAPDFSLHDGEGGNVALNNLVGTAFALLAPAPTPQPQMELPPYSYQRAPEPPAAVRLDQVREALDSAGLKDVPIIVLALPYYYESEIWDAASVADALRAQLDIPVYEDRTGHFLGSYSQFFGNTRFYNLATSSLYAQNPWILINPDGQVVDTFVDVRFREDSHHHAVDYLPLAEALRQADLGEDD